MADSYNPTASVNGPVKSTGKTKEGTTPSTPPKATGRPQGVLESDGRNSPRVTVQTIQASLPSSPSGGGNKWPSGVASYKDVV